MDTKKRRILEFDGCCICGQCGSTGMANIFNLSLRENDVSKSFFDIIVFALEIEVQFGASDICATCKQRIIEFYHFKRRSQFLNPILKPPQLSSLAQDTALMVDSYLKKYSIKALRIEENDEKLVIMRKPENLPKVPEPPDIVTTSVKQENDPTPLSEATQQDVTTIFSEVKQEVDADEDLCIKIKQEPELTIDDENFESNPVNLTFQSTPPQLDALVNLNQHLLSLVETLNSKVDALGDNLKQNEADRFFSDESDDDDEEILEIPQNFTAESLTEVLHLNKVLGHRENRRMLEVMLKKKLFEAKYNYKMLLERGMNLLMSKPTQYSILYEGESILKTCRAVKCLVNVAHQIYGTPVRDLETYLNNLVHSKRKMNNKRERS